MGPGLLFLMVYIVGAYVVKVIASNAVTNYVSETDCASYPVALFMFKTKEITAVLAMVENVCILVSDGFFTNPTLICTTSIWHLLSQVYWKASLSIVSFSRNLM